MIIIYLCVLDKWIEEQKEDVQEEQEKAKRRLVQTYVGRDNDVAKACKEKRKEWRLGGREYDERDERVYQADNQGTTAMFPVKGTSQAVEADSIIITTSPDDEVTAHNGEHGQWGGCRNITSIREDCKQNKNENKVLFF